MYALINVMSETKLFNVFQLIETFGHISENSYTDSENLNHFTLFLPI